MKAVLTGSGAVLGSLGHTTSEEVDRAFGMPAGKLRSRAGIESLAYVAESENELTLAAKAAREALRAASCGTQELDWIVTPAKRITITLRFRLNFILDYLSVKTGGDWMSRRLPRFAHALVFAQSLIGSGQAQTVAVVTADVHSRTLTPGRVAGEFGGLFGDGASAFILRSAAGNDSNEGYRLGEFLFGCAASTLPPSRSAIRRMAASTVQFDGRSPFSRGDHPQPTGL